MPTRRGFLQSLAALPALGGITVAKRPSSLAFVDFEKGPPYPLWLRACDVGDQITVKVRKTYLEMLITRMETNMRTGETEIVLRAIDPNMSPRPTMWIAV